MEDFNEPSAMTWLTPTTLVAMDTEDELPSGILADPECKTTHESEVMEEIYSNGAMSAVSLPSEAGTTENPEEEDRDRLTENTPEERVKVIVWTVVAAVLMSSSA